MHLWLWAIPSLPSCLPPASKVNNEEADPSREPIYVTGFADAISTINLVSTSASYEYHIRFRFFGAAVERAEKMEKAGGEDEGGTAASMASWV